MDATSLRSWSTDDSSHSASSFSTLASRCRTAEAGRSPPLAVVVCSSPIMLAPRAAAGHGLQTTTLDSRPGPRRAILYRRGQASDDLALPDQPAQRARRVGPEAAGHAAGEVGEPPGLDRVAHRAGHAYRIPDHGDRRVQQHGVAPDL